MGGKPVAARDVSFTFFLRDSRSSFSMSS